MRNITLLSSKFLSKLLVFCLSFFLGDVNRVLTASLKGSNFLTDCFKKNMNFIFSYLTYSQSILPDQPK